MNLLTATLLSAACLAAQTQTKVVVDFENAAAITRHENQSKTKQIKSTTGHALQITTDAAADYPSVTLAPAKGKWNLTGFDGVEMDVRNTQDVPVRILLSINNPGSDGQKNCNCEAVVVPPKSHGKVVVPFGMWHGEAGHDLDLSNIVSFQVLLDKPKRSHTFTFDNIRAVKHNRMTIEQARAEPFFQQLKPMYGRGINLGNALEAPKEGEWGVTLDEKYFDLIKEAGFDSIRIPIRWSAHAEEKKPYRIDPKFFQRVDWVVRNCLSRRLTPILNIHHYDGLTSKPAEHRQRFLALWEQIATHYKGYPSALSFELLNEPHDNLNAEAWNALLAETLTVVRRTNPKRRVVVGAIGWNSINDLDSLKLPAQDRNLVVTFHYYSPFKFTHQGASWVGDQSRAWLGTTWTGTESEKAAVTQELDRAIIWAVQHRRPIYMGEFGAYSKADIKSRARWTTFLAEEAGKRKIGYAYWEFCSGFGVYDADRGKWIEPLKKALLP